MELAREIVAWVLLVGGGLFSIIGGIGLLRLPDFYSRTHGGGLTDTAGAGLILLGLMVEAGVGWSTLKLLSILVFWLVSSPTATHALAHAALTSGLRPLTGDEEGRSSTP